MKAMIIGSHSGTASSTTNTAMSVNQLSRLLARFEMVRGVVSAVRHVPDSVSQNS